MSCFVLNEWINVFYNLFPRSSFQWLIFLAKFKDLGKECDYIPLRQIPLNNSSREWSEGFQ